MWRWGISAVRLEKPFSYFCGVDLSKVGQNEKGNLRMDRRKMQNQSEKQRPAKRISVGSGQDTSFIKRVGSFLSRLTKQNKTKLN